MKESFISLLLNEPPEIQVHLMYPSPNLFFILFMKNTFILAPKMDSLQPLDTLYLILSV